ncbi:MAG: tetratricopeptide repeat protein [Chitinophagaceae bacterium]|nr:tetratricopeptide repeat protein [Anaerolineae bacterium]
MAYTPLQLAEAFLKAGELPDALDALNQQLAVTPKDDDVLRLRAQVYMRGGRAQFQLAYTDLSSLQDKTRDDIFSMSVVLEKMGRLEEALVSAGILKNFFEIDDRLRERYIHLLHRLERFDEARAAAQLAAQQHPDDWRWRQWVGDLAVESGDDKAAADAYTDALAIIRARYEFDFNAPAAVLENAGGDAISLTIVASYARLLVARGHVLRRLHYFDDSEADYVAAEKLLPSDAAIPFNRGLVAALRGDSAEAESLCRAALASATPALRAHLIESLEEEPDFENLASLLNL